MGRNAEFGIVAAVRPCNCHWAFKGCSVNYEEEEEDWEDSEKMEGFLLTL